MNSDFAKRKNTKVFIPLECSSDSHPYLRSLRVSGEDAEIHCVRVCVCAKAGRRGRKGGCKEVCVFSLL